MQSSFPQHVLSCNQELTGQIYFWNAMCCVSLLEVHQHISIFKALTFFEGVLLVIEIITNALIVFTMCLKMF